jgi:PAS domain S-box-containing protein
MMLDFKFRRLSIRGQLLLLMAAAVLPAIGGFAWLISHQREQARDAAYAQVRIVASSIATQIYTLLSDSETMLDRLAGRPSVRALDPGRCDSIFQEHLLLRRESTVLVLRDAQGRLICSSSSGAPQRLTGPGFIEAIASNRFMVSNAFLGPASGRWVADLTYPVRDGTGQVAGLLMLGIDLLKFQEQLIQANPPSAHLSVFDREYKFLMRSVDPEKWIGKPLPASQRAYIKDQDESYSSSRDVAGVPHLWANLRVRDIGWIISAGLPEDEVFAASRQDLQRSVAVGIGVVLLILALGWPISRPIRGLARTSERLIAGDASARALLGGPVEIEAVAAHFNRLLDERERTLQTLQRREAQLSEAQRIAQVGSWELDLVGNKLTWSDEIFSIFEIDRTKFGATYEAFLAAIHPEDREAVNAAYTGSLATRKPYDITHRLLMADGRIKHVHERCESEFDAEGKPLRSIGTVQDISARKLADEALAESHRLLQAIIDTAPVRIFWKDRELRFLGCNRAFAKDAGVAHPDDLIGKDDYQLSWKAQAELYRADDQRTMDSGIPKLSYDEPQTTPDGHDIWLRTSKVPLRNEENEIVGVLGVYDDITESKRAEAALNDFNRELEQRVRERTAKLEEANKELATFTYSVSHDLKGPLRGIDGYSRLLLADHSDKLDDEGRRFLVQVRQAAQQMGRLIDDLLAYSRLERRDMRADKVNPQELIEALLVERAEEIKTRGVAVNVAVSCTSVTADRDGLVMALHNLLENALKFSRSALQPEIEIAGRDTGTTCIFSVRDNGIGFDMKFHDQIFGIFERLHRSEDYPGTGVGLAIVKKAMERMGGRAWAESEPGVGATFYLEIPE